MPFLTQHCSESTLHDLLIERYTWLAIAAATAAGMPLPEDAPPQTNKPGLSANEAARTSGHGRAAICVV